MFKVPGPTSGVKLLAESERHVFTGGLDRPKIFFDTKKLTSTVRLLHF
jgi:hypothetical protein